MTYLPTKAAHERLVKMLKIFSKRTEHVVKETESVRIKRLLMLGTKMSSRSSCNDQPLTVNDPLILACLVAFEISQQPL